MGNKLAGQITKQRSTMGCCSAEIVDFISVTHDLIFLSSAPCQELQSGFIKKYESLKM